MNKSPICISIYHFEATNNEQLHRNLTAFGIDKRTPLRWLGSAFDCPASNPLFVTTTVRLIQDKERLL